MTTSAFLLITNIAAEQWHAKITGGGKALGIGRDPDNEICIPAAYSHVSRRHASIEVQQGSLWIRDVGSHGGTRVNGVPVLSGIKTRVEISDRISLARLELYVVSPEAGILQNGHPRTGGNDSDDWEFDRNPIALTQQARLRELSSAELEVVRWICRGVSTFDEIGGKLFRSPHTVRTQVNSIYEKLDVHSRESVVTYIRQCDLHWTGPLDADDAGPSSRSTTST